jgi:hypothetical protein
MAAKSPGRRLPQTSQATSLKAFERFLRDNL